MGRRHELHPTTEQHGGSIGEEREPAPATPAPAAPAPATFEVTDIGPPYRKGFFRKKFVPVTMKATTAITYKKHGPARHKYGSFRSEIYCAEFSQGDVITIDVPY